jgi:hypothetical protein
VKTSTPLWLRYLAIVLGILFFIWLPIEDMHEGYVLTLAGGISAWLALRFLVSTRGDRDKFTLRWIAVGLAAGMAVTPVTLLLMILKNGTHTHEVPDFTPYQMARVIELTPYFAGAGLLAGLGSSLWKIGKDS